MTTIEQRPKMSVIIPVFGVEKYIERCARSMFEQTMDNIEFIFVDDCTQDNSIYILQQVLNEYPSRAANTHIPHHEVNKGLPIARQTGLKTAKGEYIIHCDSDDWLLPESYQEIYDKAKEIDADMVVFDIEESDGNKELRKIVGAKTNNVHQFTKDMMYMRSSWSLINKLFRRNVYDEIKYYPQVGVGEDMGLTLQLIHYCKRMAYINKAYYKYFVSNPESMTHNITEEKAIRRYEQDKANAEVVFRFYENHAADESIQRALNYVRWSVRKPIWGLIHKKEFFKLWKATYPGIEKKLFADREVTNKEKLQMVLSYLRLYPKKSSRILT